jgi:manganese/zinc/iron transport system permease protein
MNFGLAFIAETRFLGLDGDQLGVLAVGSLVGASCALVGSFLVLRRMAMLGDAISHAVLPGIVVMALITGSLASIFMVIGAALFGVLTVFLVGLLHRTGRLREDASIGVVFPALFAVGVILVSRYTGGVHIDENCVLYGEIELVSLDQLVVGDQLFGPRALWIAGAILLGNLLLVCCFFKELKLTSFDPDLAASLGISPVLLHYVLMIAVSVTAVGSFESVGAILVVAMLIVPPATAYLLTDRLGVMLVFAVTLGVLSAWLGYFMASALDCSVAGSMAASAGALFVIVFFCSPRHGLLARWLTRRVMARRFQEHLLLLHIRTADGGATPLISIARRFNWSQQRIGGIVGRLVREGLVELAAESIQLTARGRQTIEESGTSPLVHRL